MFAFHTLIRNGRPFGFVSLKLFLIATILTFSILPGQAKTLSVPDSSPTIKGALIQAEAGDIILVSCGTYYEHDIRVKPGVALWSGTLQPGCVTIDAQDKGRVFIFADADTSTALVGFTLRGGRTSNNGGAILCRNSSPRISNCIFQDNAASSGGALFSDEASAPVVSNCLFENNRAQIMGGAIHCTGKADYLQCAFEGNHALLGGGLALMQSAKLNLSGCSLQGNSAGNTGGGLHLVGSDCVIANCIFVKNWGGLGGSSLSTLDSELLIQNSTLYRNSSDTAGGVLAIKGKHPVVQNTIIAFNSGFILRSDSPIPHFQGCNLFGNEGGDWAADLSSLGNKNKNLSRDPMFCSAEYGNFSLNTSSSCLPDNNPTGNKGIVGAYGPGCSDSDDFQPEQAPSVSGFRAIRSGL
jgi:predicted outer membrane repeat protein